MNNFEGSVAWGLSLVVCYPDLGRSGQWTCDPEWKNWTKALTGDVGSALVSLPWKMCSQRSHLLSLGKAGPRRGSPFGVSKGSDVNASKPVVNTGAHMPA